MAERRRRRGWRVLALIVGFAALAYAVLGREPVRLDDDVRAASGSRFVRLTDGVTRYDVAGSAADPVVVLVHGTTVPSFVWDRNIEPLVAAGLRVVRYDLYGRGLSDRVAGPYDLALFTRQLGDLIDQVAPERPVSLVGASIGGMIIAEYARQHPQRVERLVLVDPAGVGTDLPLVARVATAPGVGEYLLRVLGSRQLRPARRMLLHPERYPSFDSLYLSTLSIRGSRRAVLSTLRTVPFTGYEDGFRAIREIGAPTLLVWGRHDPIVPFENSDAVRELVDPAGFVVVEEAAHFPNYEQPEIVNAELVSFLRPAAEAVPETAAAEGSGSR